VTFRAFISTDLDGSPALDRFLAELRSASRDVKVVSGHQLHLTLKFLGETEDGLVPEILGILKRACAGRGPVHVQVRGTGAFPSLSRMSVIWVGLEGAEEFAGIAARLDDGLSSLGFPKETRAWTPHVTVARVRSRQASGTLRSLVEAHQDELFAEADLAEVRLKKSVLMPTGPVYSDIGIVRLERAVG
jgi:RNA 2',3'-cyclic 3'-phosphodiesterase